MMLKQPPVDTEWQVTACHRVEHPQSINSDTLAELRSRVQALADKVPPKARNNYPIGPLEFRYEADPQDYVTKVHAYFVGVNGLRLRFMRLERSTR